MTLSILLLIALAADGSHDPVERETVDAVEINHYYTDNGDLVFDQIIYWEWAYDRHRVVSWRIATDGRCKTSGKWIGSADYLPQRIGGRWRIVTPVGVVVDSITVRHSWTQQDNDPEMQDREKWPRELRRRKP